MKKNKIYTRKQISEALIRILKRNFLYKFLNLEIRPDKVTWLILIKKNKNKQENETERTKIIAFTDKTQMIQIFDKEGAYVVGADVFVEASKLDSFKLFEGGNKGA